MADEQAKNPDIEKMTGDLTPEQRRARALGEIVEQIAGELNAMIADPELEFDIVSAASVCGNLFSMVLRSMDTSEEHKIKSGIVWLDTYLRMIDPDLQMTSGSFNSIDDMVAALMLDDAVASQGRGNGN
ncbi:MAG: hypothetical protein QNI96_05090 [Woeseiaceae bacterium]|nr:hypothetical protein [Woeseiaceae bacterium]